MEARPATAYCLLGMQPIIYLVRDTLAGLILAVNGA